MSLINGCVNYVQGMIDYLKELIKASRAISLEEKLKNNCILAKDAKAYHISWGYITQEDHERMKQKASKYKFYALPI